ncbi:MAG TPA: hypothetical protein DCS87_11820 [Rheinheimera sp.]|nr:hypothetical protein [Rheinheimera sp.]
MITGKTITGIEAVDQFGLYQMLSMHCVVVTKVLGDGQVQLRFGGIVDPSNCTIDEPDGALFYVEYEENDDFYLESVFEDTQIVLLEVV